MKSPRMTLAALDSLPVFSGAILSLLCASVALAQAPQRARDFVASRILVKFNSEVGPEQAHHALAGQQSRCIGEIPEIGAHIVELPIGAIDTVYAKAFQERPDVESAQVDRTISVPDTGAAYAAAADTTVLAAAPPYAWSKAFGSATNDQGNAVARDASGNVYVTGAFTGSVSFGGQSLACPTFSDGCLFLAKFAADGTPLWSKSFSNDYGAGRAVGIDAVGNVFLAGSFSGANFGCGLLTGSIFAVKLLADGSCVWSKPFKSVATGGISNAGGNDVINGLTIDAGGDVFLAGKFGCATNEGCAINFGGGLIASAQTPSYGGVFMAKLLGTDGSHRWSKAYGGVSGQDYAAGVAVDTAGNAFVAGYFSSTILNLGGANLANGGSSDVFVAKYRGSDGAPLWSKRFGGMSTDMSAAVAVDSGGAAVVVGQFQGTADFGGTSLISNGAFQPDIFLARYDSSNGDTLWAKRFGGTIADTGRAIATDGNGHIVITGYFMGTVDFGNGVPLTATGLDIFLAQYDIGGVAQWAKGFGGLSSDVGLGVATDNSGNTLMTGYFQGSVDFGGGPINGGGALDIFLAKYGSSGGGKTNTTTTLTSSLNPSTYSQNVTFTATVSPLAATGTMTFLDGGVTLGTSAVIGGSAIFTTFSLAAGAHSITASYGGDANYNGSSSAAVSQTVNKAGTSTGLTSSLNPSNSGQSVTFTAAVSPSSATGPVTFKDGATTLGTGTLSGGIATYSTSSLSVGSHSITATYGGDSSYNGSTSPTVTQTVNTAAPTNTTTSLASNVNPSTYGQPITFTATVSPSAATGTVTFKDGATTIGTGTLVGGIATYSTSSLSAGAHSITASYGGNASYNGSTSAILSQTVNKAGTSTALTSSPNPSTSGQSVTFTATVSPSSATGTVTFKDGATTLGTGTLSGGSATYSTSSLSVGSHSITATYNGDSNYNGSISPALTQTVNTAGKTNTTTTLTSGVNPSTSGQSVTFTATVSPSTATGLVWFYDGSTSLGSGALSGGKATYSTSALSVGNHPIAASYPGDSNHNGSATAPLTQTVNTGGGDTTPPTVSITSPANGATVSGTINITGLASDNSGVTPTVTVVAGGVTVCTVNVSPYSCAWNTTSAPNGSKTITATARDGAGNNSVPASVTVTVNNAASPPDTTLPTVSFSSPLQGSSWLKGMPVPVTINASDNVGVVSVEFWADGKLKATWTAGPYSTSWIAPNKPGSHTLEARARDAAGNVGSQTITVNVTR